MGLDMVIYSKKVVANKVIDEAKWLTSTTYVEEGLGYWRKFNALHGFIVLSFADGEDDCNPVWLREENIEEIISTLKAIKEDNSKAMELMPPYHGFFFGSYEIDEWYLKNIEMSIPIFENALSRCKEEDIFYEASW